MTFTVPVKIVSTSGDGKAAFDNKNESSWKAEGKGQNVEVFFPKTVNVDKIELKFADKDGTYEIYFKDTINDYVLATPQFQSKGTKEYEVVDVDLKNIVSLKIVGLNDVNEIVDIRFDTEDCNCCKPICECEPVPVPPSEDKGRVKDWGSTDDDPNNWKVVSMSNPKNLFKVVDKDNVNRADMFNTKKGAEAFIAKAIKDYKPDEPDPEPEPEPNPDPNQPTDGIALVYPKKAGGQEAKKFGTAKRSSHNTGKRDSFYTTPKGEFTATNAQIGLYLRYTLSQDDQGVIKLLSGGHGDSPLEQGRCYAVGIQVNKGKASTFHLAKEYPKHPETPKFPKQIKLLNNTALPDINGKTVGYRLVGYVTAKGTFKGRLDLDLSVLDTKPEDLKTCPNKFVPYMEFEDSGNWTGPALTENQGIKFKGDPMGYYIRIDKVTSESTANFQQAVEIVPPKE